MEIIYILLPASLLLGVLALVAYIWAVKSGQYDDLETPSLRMLSDDVEVTSALSNTSSKQAKAEKSPQD